MHSTRSSLIRLAAILVLPLVAAAQTPAAASESFSGPLDLLGIARFECRCSQTRESGSDTWLWLFVSEPTIGALDPDGPSQGKLRAGDVIVAVDGWLITTRGGGERFSQISPDEPVEITVRRGGIERRERIVPRVREEGDDAPELEQLDTPLTVKLAELSEALAELALVSPELDELSELGELPALPELPTLIGLSELGKLSLLGDLKIDTRPLGWFGFGLSFSGSMRQRAGADEPPLWDFDAPPKVRSLAADGPAARAGLRRGDVLTHIDGVRLDSEEGGRLFSEVQPGQVIDWTVRRRGASLTIPIVAEERPE
jgi:hypothetical protein